jgi:hypothetical protein
MNRLATAAVALAIGATAILATGPSVVAKTHHVKAPKACVTAIKDYQVFAGYMGQFATIAGGYESQIVPAATAGQNQDAAGITAITNKMTVLTTQTNTITAKIKALTPGLHRAVASCEGS